MWYWVKRIEGMFFLPLLPIYLIYWKLRKIAFHLRCRHCGKSWLFLDLRYMRDGMCEKCLQNILNSTPTESQKVIFEETKTPTIKPEFDWLFKRIVKKVGHGNVLDVGCNTGYLLSKLNAPTERLFGVDMVSKPIKIASNLIKGGNFCLSDVRKIPYKSNTFDYLFCTEVLEHIVEGDEVVKECYRVVKPNGIALITVPNGKGAVGKYMVAHIRFFTLKSITNLLREAGFEIVSVRKFGIYIPLLSSFIDMVTYLSNKDLPFSSVLWRLSVPEFFALGFYIECRKPASLSKDKDT